MRPSKLQHEESSLYSLSLQIHHDIVVIARRESRTISDSLQRHALRLVEHVAASTGMTPSRSQTRSIDYAKLALVKLAAVLDAAACEEASSAERRERTLMSLRRLESELSPSLATPTPRPARREPSTGVRDTQLRRRERRAPKPSYGTVHDLGDVGHSQGAESHPFAEPSEIERSVPSGTA